MHLRSVHACAEHARRRECSAPPSLLLSSAAPCSLSPRPQIYLLYHYLNHLNLFGGSYYGSCERLLKSLTQGL